MSLIYAHRGASGYAPENTMEAFTLAAQQGADGIELDVRRSRDGELVVVHDERVERVWDGFGRVRDLTLSQLRRMRPDRALPPYVNARVPTLEEVLTFAREKNLLVNLEIKGDEADDEDVEERCLALSARCGMEKSVLYSSFDTGRMLRVRQIDPTARCALLCTWFARSPAHSARDLGMNALHPPYRPTRMKAVCARAHALGLAVNVWGVNRPRALSRCFLAGVDGVITNYPDQALTIRNIIDGKNGR